MPTTSTDENLASAPADDDAYDNSSGYVTSPMTPSAPTAALHASAGDGATSNASLYAYASPEYGRGYAELYPTNTGYTKADSTATLSGPQTDQAVKTAPSLPPLSPGLGQSTTVALLAMLPSGFGAAPPQIGSPPTARSPSHGPLSLDFALHVPIAEPVALPPAGGQETLVSPVAEAESSGEWKLIGNRVRAGWEFDAFAHAQASQPVAEAAIRPVLTGHAGVSSAALEKGLDAVFERLDQLGGVLAEHGQVSRVGQWVVIAGGACAAFEYARARYREGGVWQAAPGGPNLYEPRLRRRWFAAWRNSR